MTRTLLAALAWMMMLGCATAAPKLQPGSGESAGMSRVRMDAAPSLAAEPAVSASRMILRTGSIEVVVPVPEETARRLTTEIGAFGGFVSDSTESEDSVHIAARVPSVQLETFLDAVAAFGQEEKRTLTGQDVTDAHADLQAEVDNLRSLRDRLRTLLDKARTVKEVLEVERELTRVQTRLDWLTGRLQRMEKDVAMSRVDIYLSMKPEKRILGPLGLLYEGVKWCAIKLWVISP